MSPQPEATIPSSAVAMAIGIRILILPEPQQAPLQQQMLTEAIKVSEHNLHLYYVRKIPIESTIRFYIY